MGGQDTSQGEHCQHGITGRCMVCENEQLRKTMANAEPEVGGAVLSRTDLVIMLRDMANVVEASDSFEGRVAYGIGMGPPPPGEEDRPELEPDQFYVRAFYRVGNSMGQGGAVMVDKAAQLKKDS